MTVVDQAVEAQGSQASYPAARWFFRDGRPALRVSNVSSGKPAAWVLKICGRCGGAGGSERWRHTGWTCFECGGKGDAGHRSVPV